MHDAYMRERPAKFLLIESRLGRDLADYIDGERANGGSYRTIASHLREQTQIQVSHEALRQWDQVARAAA